MKKPIIALVTVLVFVMTSPGWTSVVGSKHDLSTAGGGNWQSTDETEVCVFCHTPHSASPAVPLWNHEIRNATYSLYSSPTLQATPGQPQGVSLLCLSCHDGVTALNSLVNPSPTQPTMDPMGDQLGDVYYPGSPYAPYPGANIGGNYAGHPNINNLSDDHPVSFTFDAALVASDGELALPPTGDAIRLYGADHDQMECSSCHDVHSTTHPPFLVKSNDGSNLCKTCHVK
jgi:predicted CXXCH cytochrome family protein